jgi:imidazolonepropionase-like amidohydrolase
LQKLFITIFLIIFNILQSQEKPIAIIGGNVITGTGERPIINATILIKKGRLEYVGAYPIKRNLNAYKKIDATAKWITPGIIETNVHLILNIIPEFYIKYEDRLEDIAIQSAQIGLKYGMTTMADSWGPLEPLLSARDRIKKGEFIASDVLIAGNIIGTGGPYSSYFMGGYDLKGKSLRYGEWVHPNVKKRINILWEAGMGPDLMAVTPEEAAIRMREYIALGVDFIKLGISGHGIKPVEPLMFSDEVLEAMVDEIRKSGLPYQTHTFTIESLRQAIQINPDLIQHPNVMNPSWMIATEMQKDAIRGLIKEIKKKGIYSGLMAIPEKRQIEIYKNWSTENSEDPWLNEIIQYRKKSFENVTYDQLAAGVKEWLNAGVSYTIATDQGPEANELGATLWGRLGRAHFDRMIALQDAGADPMDILIAATRNGAAAYRLQDIKGTIEIGKIADLLILDADPLQDIGNFRRINIIIKDGRIVDREALPSIHVLDYNPELPWPH